MLLLMYLKGFVFAGAPAMFFVGPVLLTLLQASIQQGFRAGLIVAMGISFSDVVCVALVYVGVGPFLVNPDHKWLFGIVGGCVLAGFGLALLLSTPKLDKEPVELNTSRALGLFAKGFVVNFANPFVFAYWIGALGIMASTYTLNALHVSVYFGGAITVIFTTDALKALLAEKLKSRLNEDILGKINRYAGLGLVLFGVAMVVRVLL